MTSDTLTKREADALAAWDALPANGRKYSAVADVLGVTEGRGADYVRKALAKTNRLDEAPRGRGNGNSTPTVQTPEAMMQAAAEQLRHRIEALEQGGEEFDAEAWRQDQEATLAERVKAAQATLKQWRDDAEQVATNAAEAEAKRQSARAEANEEQAETLRATLASYEAALAAMTAAA